MACFPDVHAPSELSLFTAICMVFLTLVTVAGNASVVVTIAKDPLNKLHTPFNYFLLNLALSDLLLGFITMPVGVLFHIEEYNNILDLNVARTLHMSLFISGTASLLR